MKQHNYIYDTRDAFYDFLDHVKIDRNADNILIQMFSSELKRMQKIASEVTQTLPYAILIGASTAGEIISGKVIDNSTVLSISVFEKSSLKSFHETAEDSYELGLSLSKKIFNKDTKCVITFLDGLGHNGQEYLQGLNAMNCNHAAIAGGLAADSLNFKKTYTLCGSKIFSGGAVCVALSGEDLEVFQDYNLGWRAVGPSFTITKSDGARVYEIDHRPVKDVYEEVLGSFAVENMPASTIEFPLILQDKDMLIARSMLSVAKDGSILYGGNLEEGSEVRFGIGSRTLVNQYNPKQQLKEAEKKHLKLSKTQRRQAVFLPTVNSFLMKNRQNYSILRPLCFFCVRRERFVWRLTLQKMILFIIAPKLTALFLISLSMLQQHSKRRRKASKLLSLNSMSF